MDLRKRGEQFSFVGSNARSQSSSSLSFFDSIKIRKEVELIIVRLDFHDRTFKNNSVLNERLPEWASNSREIPATRWIAMWVKGLRARLLSKEVTARGLFVSHTSTQGNWPIHLSRNVERSLLCPRFAWWKRDREREGERVRVLIQRD